MVLENLAIGKIRTSFGLKGFVKIVSFSGEKDHFFSLKEVTIKTGSKTEKKEIEKISLNGDDLIIKFFGVETPEQAKKYTGWEIWTARKNAAALKKNEYYAADLAGCTLVYCKNGENLPCGKVKSVLSGSGTTDFLEIQPDVGPAQDEKAGKTFLVPFIDKFVGKVDIKAGTIELLEKWIIP